MTLKLKEQIGSFCNEYNIPPLYSRELKKLYPKQLSPMLDRIKDYDSIYFSGNPGTGKTITAIAHVFDKLQYLEMFRPNRIMFINTTKLLFEIRQTFSKKKHLNENYETAEEALLYNCIRPDVLILDDFGIEKYSDFTLQTLYLIINRRYELNKSIIITSNLELSEVADKMEDNRLTSRIQAMCQLVDCSKQYRNV